jgi:putative transposase
MPRPLRPIADRLVYHVINRGNNRAAVFHHEDDYAAFLRAIADLKRSKPFDLYGYCLMPNHVHLLIRPHSVPISRIMQSLLISHTQRYHRCHRSGGHVWQGRFKSPVVQDDDHLLTVLRYIEANPLRAAMVADAGDYAWCSFAAHGRGATDGLLDPLAAYEALAGSPAPRRRRWSGFVHQATPEEDLAALRRSTVTGLPFGATAWVERLGATLGLDLEIRPRGRPRKAAPPAPDASAAGAPAARAGADDERR